MNAVVALIPGTVMVTAGGLCVCGAVAAKRWIGICAAAVMLAAMVDLAFLGALPPLVWAVSLVAAGLLLGLELRRDVPPVAPGGMRTERGVEVAIALSYPVMAWLLLAHGGGRRTVDTEGAHTGHDSTLWLAAAGVALILIVLLAALGVLAARRRQRLLASEAAAMSAMLAVMLLPHG